jgi:hypothetical protein
MRLKRWESPRREGRNDKGRGGSARKRQLKKQRQMLRQKLKDSEKQNNNQNNQQGRRQIELLPFLVADKTKNRGLYHRIFLDIALDATNLCFFHQY